MAKNILIVDDSVTIRSSLEYCLKEAGFNVVAAVDGIEKLKSLKNSGGSVSAIITDVNMPRMDGITFTENVKKSSFRSTPVLILTTETQESNGFLILGSTESARNATSLLKPVRIHSTTFYAKA